MKERKRLFFYRGAQSAQTELQWEDRCLQPPACLPLIDFPLVPTLPWSMAFCFVFLAKTSKTRPPDKTPIIKPSQLWPRKSKMTKNRQKFDVREETEINSRARLTFSFPSVLLGKDQLLPSLTWGWYLQTGSQNKAFLVYIAFIFKLFNYVYSLYLGTVHRGYTGTPMRSEDKLLESILSSI